MKGCEKMAYETKVLLQSQAEYALAIRDKKMYQYVSKLANVEGMSLKPYDEAVKEFDENNEDA